MKIGFLLIFLCIFNRASAQTDSLRGAWFWKNARNQCSVFLERDGYIAIHFGKPGDAIREKDLREGTYVYKDNTLSITWPDSTTEKCKVRIINNNMITVNACRCITQNLAKKLTLSRVRDVESGTVK